MLPNKPGITPVHPEDIERLLVRIETTAIGDRERMEAANLLRNYIHGLERRVNIYELERDEED